MKIPWKKPIVVVFILLPVFLLGQCPSGLNVAQAVIEKDADKLVDYANALAGCEPMQDSVGLIYHTLGVISYKKDIDKAIEYTKTALAIRQKVLPFVHIDLGQTQYNLGFFYKKKSNFELAKKHLLVSAEIYGKLDTSKVISSYNDLSSVYNGLGEFNRAIEVLKLATQKALEFEDLDVLNRSYLVLSNPLYEIQEYAEAIGYLNKALEYYESKKPSRNLIACYTNLARNYYELKDYKKAISYAEKTVTVGKGLNGIEKQGYALNNLGLYYLRDKKIDKAIRTLKESLRLTQNQKLPLVKAQSHNNLGEVYKAKGRKEQALQSFQNAISLTVDGYAAADYLRNPSDEEIKKVSAKTDLLGYLADKAKCLLEVYQGTEDDELLKKSLETYKRCDSTIDLLRSEHTDQNSKLFWREKVMPIYEKAISASQIAEDYESAFLFFEKSKAVLLLDAMLNAEAMNNIQNDSLIALEKELRRKLLKAREILEDASQQEKKEALSKMRQVNDEFDEFTGMLSESYPNYHKTKFDTEVASLSKLSNQYFQEGKTALLHYFLGKEKTWMLTLSKGEPVFKALGTAEKTDSLVVNFLSFFENREAIINAPNDYAAAAWELYQYLVAPANLSGIKELIIIPDGILGFLPFEALITKEPAENDFYGLEYLIRQHNIRLSFSATILDRQNSFSETNKRLIGFAPFASHKFNGEYSPLPDSDAELSFIKKMVSGEYFKNEEATKAQFLKYKGQFSVMHLSTHATANTNKGQPYIVFTDSLLTLPELYSLTIPCDLVVLSACETNTGEVKKGEGIFGLSRGFAYAGANSIIASLWSVNSSSTGKIFPPFYKNLQKGNSKSIALQQAKLKFIKESEEQGAIITPYDWAGFVVIGNDENIELEKPTNNGRQVLILLLAAGFILIPVLRKRKKN